MIYDASASLTYKCYVNDIVSLDATENNDEWFNNIYVRRFARISGIVGGATGSNLISGLHPGILAGSSNRAVRDRSAILNGTANLTSGTSSLAAGENNSVFGYLASALGGQLHFVEPEGASVLGGFAHVLMGTEATNASIIGGYTNVITGNSQNAIIAGGLSNRLMGLYSAIIGGQSNLISGGAGNSAIIAGNTNKIMPTQVDHSIILAGATNTISGVCAYSVIAGGQSNTIMASEAAILGGANNKVSGTDAGILAGATNVASGTNSVVAGGTTSNAFGADSFIGGGVSNFADGNDSAILAGSTNKARGEFSVVLGGKSNVSSGQYAITIGQKSEAFPNGAIMFGDSTNVVKRAYGADSFTINFSGGMWVTGGGVNARRGFNLYPTGDVPTTSTPGRSGDFAYKDNYLYIHTGDPNDTNRSWGRVALSTLDGSPPSLVSNDHAVVYCGPQTTSGGNARGHCILGYDPGNTDPYYPITFNNNSPIITLPAGNGTYLVDAIVGIYRGSDANTFTLKFRNTTDNADVASSQRNITFPGAIATEVWYNMRNFITVTASKAIQLYGAYSGANDGLNGLGVMPTGTQISYIKLR